MPISDGEKQILTSGYGTGLTQKQKDANDRQKEIFTDGQVIKDAGGDERITFTDDGSLILKDESGNTGITLNTDQSTTFAGNISASGDGSFVDLTVADDIDLATGSKIRFGSLHTQIKELSDDMFIDADSDIHMRPDADIKIAVGGAEWCRFDGSKKSLGINTSVTDVPERLTVRGNISSSGAIIYSKNTFANDDATPSVIEGAYWETGTNSDTITTFDNGKTGQIIYVLSKAAITYDVTSTTLKCGTTDLVTAAGDLTTWLYDGTNWTCLGFTDQSDDLS